MEIIWIFCVLIINSRLRVAITLKDALYRFRQGRGTVTAAMEAKLTQQLALLIHESLFQVFLDVGKSYESLDRGRCVEILRGYGLATNLQR